ncbi:flagellar basal body-associated FliL family protein [Thermodesulfobacteriota bacterium]
MQSEKRNILVSFLIFGTIISIFLLAYRFREDIKIPELLVPLVDGARPSGRYVKAILVSRIGEKDLRLKLLLPCADKQHQVELMQKMPRIKNSFLQSADHPNFAEPFDRRDFKEIKKFLLKVVNNVSDRPVKDVYFENFFYN